MTNKGTASDRLGGELFASKLIAAPSTPLRIAAARASISAPLGLEPRPLARAARAWSMRFACSFTERSMLIGATPFAANLSARFSSAAAGSWRARASAMRASTRCATSAGSTSLRRAEGSLAGVWALDPRATIQAARKSSATLRVLVIGFSFWEPLGPPTQRNAARYQSMCAPCILDDQYTRPRHICRSSFDDEQSDRPAELVLHSQQSGRNHPSASIQAEIHLVLARCDWQGPRPPALARSLEINRSPAREIAVDLNSSG